MIDFIELFEKASQQHRKISFDFGYSHVCDYCIQIYDNKGRSIGERNSPFFSYDSCDPKKLFANAYEALSEYLSNEYGGY